MKYTVNWVEKSLGVTRKALRIYEEKGLMDKKAFQNPDNKYREYSDEDIERIWCFRLLQGVGYSLNDIVEMTQNAEFDFQASLSEKVIDLERKKSEIEQYIGFAKAVKLTGSFPYPKEMGSIRFEDFIKHAREYWNVNSDPQMAALQKIVETVLNKTESEFTEVDRKQAKTALDGFDVDDFLILHAYYNDLVERKELGVSHPVVQAHVNLIYKNYCKDIAAGVDTALEARNGVNDPYGSIGAGDQGIVKQKNIRKTLCMLNGGLGYEPERTCQTAKN